MSDWSPHRQCPAFQNSTVSYHFPHFASSLSPSPVPSRWWAWHGNVQVSSSMGNVWLSFLCPPWLAPTPPWCPRSCYDRQFLPYRRQCVKCQHFLLAVFGHWLPLPIHLPPWSEPLTLSHSFCRLCGNSTSCQVDDTAGEYNNTAKLQLIKGHCLLAALAAGSQHFGNGIKTKDKQFSGLA